MSGYMAGGVMISRGSSMQRVRPQHCAHVAAWYAHRRTYVIRNSVDMLQAARVGACYEQQAAR